MIRRPPRSTLFPTRRSSDLAFESARHVDWKATAHVRSLQVREFAREQEQTVEVFQSDRKSTRLNSSHSQISYAVFCLKKKKTHIQFTHDHNNKPLFLHSPAH